MGVFLYAKTCANFKRKGVILLIGKIDEYWRKRRLLMKDKIFGVL